MDDGETMDTLDPAIEVCLDCLEVAIANTKNQKHKEFLEEKKKSFENFRHELRGEEKSV